MFFLSSADVFPKSTFFRTFFHEYLQSVKQFESRSGDFGTYLICNQQKRSIKSAQFCQSIFCCSKLQNLEVEKGCAKILVLFFLIIGAPFKMFAENDHILKCHTLL